MGPLNTETKQMNPGMKRVGGLRLEQKAFLIRKHVYSSQRMHLCIYIHLSICIF